MEELADAIEDAQYVNAIATQDDGPKPVLPWEKPSEEELAVWERKLLENYQKKQHISKNSRVTAPPFTMEWTCQQEIGYFIFSQFIKEVHDDYPRINFCEEVLRYRKIQSKSYRAEKAVLIANYFLGRNTEPQRSSAAEEKDERPVSEDTAETEKITTFSWPEPPRTEIEEYDLCRVYDESIHHDKGPRKQTKKITHKPCTAGMTEQQLEKMYNVNMDFPVCENSPVGVRGPILREILDDVDTVAQFVQLRSTMGRAESTKVISLPKDLGGDVLLRSSSVHANLQGTFPKILSTHGSLGSMEEGDSRKSANCETIRKSVDATTGNIILNPELFDKAEHVVMESLRRQYWDEFIQSTHWTKLKNFLWYQDRRVVPEDFFVMRVLGRGGFGLVTGESHKLILLL
jgi:hypothetical protein